MGIAREICGNGSGKFGLSQVANFSLFPINTSYTTVSQEVLISLDPFVAIGLFTKKKAWTLR
jgi:hypothetical protein